MIKTWGLRFMVALEPWESWRWYWSEVNNEQKFSLLAMTWTNTGFVNLTNGLSIEEPAMNLNSNAWLRLGFRVYGQTWAFGSHRDDFGQRWTFGKNCLYLPWCRWIQNSIACMFHRISSKWHVTLTVGTVCSQVVTAFVTFTLGFAE